MNAYEALIRHRISDDGQEQVAQKSGINQSTISRILSGCQGIPLERLGELLSALDLELVTRDTNAVVISRAEFDALRLLARKSLEQ